MFLKNKIIAIFIFISILSCQPVEIIKPFELDISRYQANAIVYYLKAKMFEDAGDFEKRELFLREFKKQLEKGAGALKRGPYIAQGFSKLR